MQSFTRRSIPPREKIADAIENFYDTSSQLWAG